MTTERKLYEMVVQAPVLMAKHRARSGALDNRPIGEHLNELTDVFTRNYQQSSSPRVIAGLDAFFKAAAYEITTTVLHISGVVQDTYNVLSGKKINPFLEREDK